MQTRTVVIVVIAAALVGGLAYLALSSPNKPATRRVDVPESTGGATDAGGVVVVPEAEFRRAVSQGGEGLLSFLGPRLPPGETTPPPPPAGTSSTASGDLTDTSAAVRRFAAETPAPDGTSSGAGYVGGVPGV